MINNPLIGQWDRFHASQHISNSISSYRRYSVMTNTSEYDVIAVYFYSLSPSTSPSPCCAHSIKCQLQMNLLIAFRWVFFPPFVKRLLWLSNQKRIIPSVSRCIYLKQSTQANNSFREHVKQTPFMNLTKKVLWSTKNDEIVKQDEILKIWWDFRSFLHFDTFFFVRNWHR